MNASFSVAFHLVDGLVTADIVVSSIGVDVPHMLAIGTISKLCCAICIFPSQNRFI